MFFSFCVFMIVLCFIFIVFKAAGSSEGTSKCGRVHELYDPANFVHPFNEFNGIKNK